MQTKAPKKKIQEQQTTRTASPKPNQTNKTAHGNTTAFDDRTQPTTPTQPTPKHHPPHPPPALSCLQHCHHTASPTGYAYFNANLLIARVTSISPHLAPTPCAPALWRSSRTTNQDPVHRQGWNEHQFDHQHHPAPHPPPHDSGDHPSHIAHRHAASTRSTDRQRPLPICPRQHRPLRLTPDHQDPSR